jgi:hypothetical protein
MALALRRPTMLRFSNWTADCLQVLEQSNVSIDREMAAWVKLQHIAEESVILLGFDHESPVNLNDSRSQSLLRGFEGQLSAWREKNWTFINGKPNQPSSLPTKVNFFQQHHSSFTSIISKQAFTKSVFIASTSLKSSNRHT